MRSYYFWLLSLLCVRSWAASDEVHLPVQHLKYPGQLSRFAWAANNRDIAFIQEMNGERYLHRLNAHLLQCNGAYVKPKNKNLRHRHIKTKYAGPIDQILVEPKGNRTLFLRHCTQDMYEKMSPEKKHKTFWLTADGRYVFGAGPTVALRQEHFDAFDGEHALLYADDEPGAFFKCKDKPSSVGQVTASREGGVQIYEYIPGQKVPEKICWNNDLPCEHMSIDKHGTVGLAIGDFQGEQWVNVYDLQELAVIAHLLPADKVQHTYQQRPSMSMSHDGKRIAIAHKDGYVAVVHVGIIHVLHQQMIEHEALQNGAQVSDK